ncbi:MAG: single-stranded DNA-binding protein [Sulfurimonas sp.]|nr:single-stranded DNA-binding protein [Sulfurimonas sp.]
MFNKIILVGNLTRDIELRYAQSGTAIAKTAIATSRKFTSNGEKKEEVCFVDITFFGRSGEIANQYLRKGSKILVEGRLNFEQWVDQNGQKRSKHSVIAETMQMLDSKGQTEGGGSYNAPAQGGQPAYQAPAQQQQQQSYQAPAQQQQSYQAPQQQQQPAYNNQANAQSRAMPSPDSVPVIDIDEDEIPF